MLFKILKQMLRGAPVQSGADPASALAGPDTNDTPASLSLDALMDHAAGLACTDMDAVLEQRILAMAAAFDRARGARDPAILNVFV